MVNIGEGDNDSKNEFGGSKVSQLLFMPNIQTDDEKEVENNYSMDMELLKEKLKEIGGRLKITFTSEEYCEFTVLFPIKNL